MTIPLYRNPIPRTVVFYSSLWEKSYIFHSWAGREVWFCYVFLSNSHLFFISSLSSATAKLSPILTTRLENIWSIIREASHYVIEAVRMSLTGILRLVRKCRRKSPVSRNCLVWFKSRFREKSRYNLSRLIFLEK